MIEETAKSMNGEEKPDTDKTITPSDAALATFKYLMEVIPNARNKISNIRVEELQPIEDHKFWSVVLSYDAIGDLPFETKRDYKEFKVDAKDGNVIWMKIREVK